MEHEAEQREPMPPARARSIAADAAASVTARVVAMVASSCSALIIVGSLSKGEYGAYALAAGLVGVLAVALDLGTSSSIARYIAQGRATQRLYVRVACARAGLLLAGALVVGAVGAFGDDASRFVELLPAAAAVLLTQGLIAFLYGTLPSMRRIELLVVVTVVQPVFELAGVLIVHARDGDASEMLLASAAASTVGALIGYAVLALRRRIQPDPAQSDPIASVGDVFTYGRRLIAVLILMMVFGQIDQFVIAAFHGATAVAPYAVGMKLQALLIAPVIAAVGIVAPRIAAVPKDGATTYRRWLTLFIILYAGACAVFAVLSTELFTAVNPDYRSDASLLVAMLPFIFLSAIATLPSMTLNQVGYAGSRVRIAAISLALNAVLDLALVPPLEAYGAAIASAIALGYYTWAHHRLLEPVLADAAGAPAPTITPLLARGAVLVGFAAALALILAPLVERLVDGQRASAIATVLIAAGIPAIVHLALTARLVRRGMPDTA